ncbi:DUF3012 domain-containing protein [Vibrio cholerae]
MESKGDWTAKEAGSYAKYCVLHGNRMNITVT